MIKLLVSDMDGTLLDTKHRISDFNLAAIRRAQEKGVKFMIATGRSIQTLTPILKEYNLNCELLLMNGAEVRDKERNILNAINIPRDKISEVTEALKGLGYIPEYTTNKGAHIAGDEETFLHSMTLRAMCLDREHTMTYEQAREYVQSTVFWDATTRVDSFQELLASDIEFRKVIVFGRDEEYNNQCRIRLSEALPYMSVTASHPQNLELNYIDAAKGPGLLKAIEIMGLSRDEVAVFGDGYNDESMFDLFPNSYAPSNAMPEIKAKAREVILSNNQDGVGHKILQIIGEE